MFSGGRNPHHFHPSPKAPVNTEHVPNSSARPLTKRPRLASAGDSFEIAFEEFRSSIRNTHTLRAYSRAVTCFFRTMECQGIPCEAVDRRAIAAYLEDHPGSPATKRLILSALRTYFEVTRLLPHDPTEGIRCSRSLPKRKVASLSEQAEPLHWILVSLGTHPLRLIDLRDRVLILLLAHGLTAQEISRLNATDYHRVGESVTPYLHVGPPGRERELPLSDGTATALDAFLVAAGLAQQPGRALIRSIQGKSNQIGGRLAPGDIVRLVKKISTRAGHPMTCRILRSTSLS
jgi:site-specific recombinase XerC